MGKPEIAYRREFSFDVPPAQLWHLVEETERFEGWWPWLRDFRVDGGGLVPGAVLHGVVVPPLPYRMRVDVALVACRRPESIDADVHGDLEGSATLRLRPAGTGSRVEVAWRIEMMQRPMRLASQFALPLLRFGHDAVVEATVASFRRHLRHAGRPLR
jgi:carbon monoxide dehydrogenase subunit G